MRMKIGMGIGARKLFGGIPPITGTAPVLASLVNGDTLSAKVTWGSYSGTGAVTTTKQMKLNAGAWVAYVGGTVVATGELWQVRELCSDTLVTDQPFESAARTVTTAATAPAAITSGQWTLVDSPSAGGDTGTLTLTALPADGGSPITSYEFRRNGGAPTTLAGLGTGARQITVLATTLADCEVRSSNAIGPSAWSDTKSFTPTVSGLYAARFGIGSEQGSGTGAFDTNLYAGGPASNATASGFTVASGIITPDGTQVAGSYTVGGWPITVTSGHVAVKTQGQWDALTPASISGKTVIVREAAGLTSGIGWNNGGDFNWATILGDGDDPRPTTETEIEDASDDSRKHFVSFYGRNHKKLILDRLRVVTGSAAGAKVVGILWDISGGTISDIHVLRCFVVASRPDPFGDYTGGITSFPGDMGITVTGANVARVSIRDNVVIGSAGDPGSIAAVTATGYCEIVGNWVDLHYSDGIRPSPGPLLFGGNLVTRPMSLPGDTGGPHCDGMQTLGAQGVSEANAFIIGDSRGDWQSFFAAPGTHSLIVRNTLVADDALYQLSIADMVGCNLTNNTWLPKSGVSFPLSNPQGGIRYDSPISGTNDVVNSIHRLTSSSIDGSVVQTGNVNAQSWVSADWTTAFPNWDIPALPTLQNALQYHALPSSGGAAAGKGANQNITSWGAERSSYVLNYTTPTVSSISITPTSDGFTGTLRTDVGNNAIYYCVIPQADPNPTWREIKEQRISAAVGYGSVWCGRAEAGTDLAIAISSASPGVAYKLCIVAENGWSVRSSITTSNFTTVAAGITRIGVGATAITTGTSLVVPLPTAINGDYFVAIINHRDAAAPTTPSGWTLIGDGDGWAANSAEIAVYGRTRDGTEGSNVTFTTGTSGNQLGFCAAYRGVNGSGTDAAGGEATAKVFSSTTQATPTLTASANSCILHIWALSSSTARVITLPNAGDLVAEVYNAASSWYLGAENQLSVSAGVTTARTATSDAGWTWNAMQVELLKA